jgi:hypothetical protein
MNSSKKQTCTPSFLKNSLSIALIRGSFNGWSAENLTGVPEAKIKPQGRGKIHVFRR